MKVKKQRLLKCINSLGFFESMKITGLAGATLGLYADPDSNRFIPDNSLKLLELQLSCMKQQNS